MSLTLELNGRERTFDGCEPGSSLSAIVAELGLKADRVAVEKNGKIVARSSWESTTVGSGDRLEVVHFVGGGACA